jgi:hypothetical protein
VSPPRSAFGPPLSLDVFMPILLFSAPIANRGLFRWARSVVLPGRIPSMCNRVVWAYQQNHVRAVSSRIDVGFLFTIVDEC